MSSPPLAGLFRLQYSFDVGEEIDLEAVRRILKLEKPGAEPAFRRLAPDYVRFERPPLEERLPALKLATGEHFPARIRYFDYGVVCVEMELPFEADWPGLIALAAKWVDAAELESVAEATARRQMEHLRSAIKKPAQRTLSEDYTVIELRRVSDEAGLALSSSRILSRYGMEIAQVVRGEQCALSEVERQEVLASSMSYSPNDLLVVGWSAALIYDTQPDGAAPVVVLLEYANTQLLEFRHYDQVLTKVLEQVYDLLQRKSGFFSRWKMAREAEQLNALLLDIRELTERTDNSIKFLSDMYYARLYRLASARIGVPDYRHLVEGKLKTAGELYRFLMDEFHQARAFILELMVVVILIIDLVFLFRGKK